MVEPNTQRQALPGSFAFAILDAVDAHVAVIDESGLIVAVNEPWRTFARENGLRPERAGPGVDYLEVCDRADHSGAELARSAAEGIRSLLQDRRDRFELEYPCHSPMQQRWFVMRAVRFEHEGRSFVALAHSNVSVPRLAELRAAHDRQAAETATQLRDQFIAILSHELRTPLTPVLLRVSMLLRDPALSREMRQDLEMICRNIELEARLIEDVLDMTRAARGRLQLRLETVDAHARLCAAADIYRADAKAKRLALELDLRADQHFVHADPARLQQVFWNLIGNAVKFTPAGGRIHVTTDTAGNDEEGSIAPLPPANRQQPALRVTVTDTGIGIEPEVLPHIFESFYQGERTQVREFGGLGLGLAITRPIVTLLGGRIEAFSEGKGRGATFTVMIPTVPQPQRAGALAVMPEGQPPRMRILLVEDDPDTADALAALLRMLGYQAQTAGSIAAALEAASADAFDLVICDIGLPDGTGWDLIARLRERSAVKAIALSGYTFDDDVARSRLAGFAAHVAKPVMPEQLQAAIARVMQA